MKRLSILFVVMMASIFSHMVRAEPDGTCWTEPLMLFPITFPAGSFSSYKAGSTMTISFGDKTPYELYCAPNPDGKTLRYSKGAFGPGADATGTTLHLSDSLDATVTLYAQETGSGAGVVPYTDKNTNSQISPPRAGGKLSGSSTYGESGQITFTLTKDAVGGAVIIPPGKYIFASYRSVYTGVYADNPVTLGYTVGQIFPVTGICKINNGNTIVVDFSDIPFEQLKTDGPSSTIKKDIPLTYSCSNSLTQDIDITLVAAPASFTDTAIKTSSNELGVVMMYKDEVVAPNTHFTTTVVKGTGSDTITFSPVIPQGSVSASVQGKFTASATLIMTSA